MLILIGMITAAFVSETCLCDEGITEVIVSGIEAFISHAFSLPIHSKPWFNTACSRVIHKDCVEIGRPFGVTVPK